MREYCAQFSEGSPNGLQQLAKAMGCRVQEVCSFKSGARRPNSEKTIAAIEFLSCTPLSDFFRDGKLPPVTKRERAKAELSANDPLHLFNAVLAKRAAPSKSAR